jgi:uncharacterized protein (TIGR02246 family)
MIIRGIITLSLCLSLATAGLASHHKREGQLRARCQAFAEAWATHDANLMASFFAPDGDNINPLGRVARGRYEIAHMIHDEHATFFRDSTMEILSNNIQFHSDDWAFADWDVVVHNERMPDGRVQDNKFHVFLTFRRHDGDWWVQNCRPYQFMQTSAPAVEAAPMSPPPAPEAPPAPPAEEPPPVTKKHKHKHHKKAKVHVEKAVPAPAPVTEAPTSPNAPVPPNK